jgi:hypothetical protein
MNHANRKTVEELAVARALAEQREHRRQLASRDWLAKVSAQQREEAGRYAVLPGEEEKRWLALIAEIEASDPKHIDDRLALMHKHATRMANGYAALRQRAEEKARREAAEAKRPVFRSLHPLLRHVDDVLYVCTDLHAAVRVSEREVVRCPYPVGFATAAEDVAIKAALEASSEETNMLRFEGDSRWDGEAIVAKAGLVERPGAENHEFWVENLRSWVESIACPKLLVRWGLEADARACRVATGSASHPIEFHPQGVTPLSRAAFDTVDRMVRTVECLAFWKENLSQKGEST